MAQTAAERRTAQRRTARQLRRGERPLGGEYQRNYVSALRRQAFNNIENQIGHYIKYRSETVHKSVYQVMSIDQIIWSISASAEEIRSRAGNSHYLELFESTYKNPWWYHSE